MSCVARFTVCFRQSLKLALVYFNRGSAQQVQFLVLRGGGKNLRLGYNEEDRVTMTLWEGQGWKLSGHVVAGKLCIGGYKNYSLDTNFQKPNKNE